MNEYKTNKTGPADGDGFYLAVCLFLSRFGAFILSLYALYFAGGAIIRIDIYECAASPLLLIIILCWRELNRIYEAAYDRRYGALTPE